MSDYCEWNPTAIDYAKEGDPFHAYATWSIGSGKGNIRVCAHCAQLPRFKRYRKRAEIRAGRAMSRSAAKKNQADS